MRARTRNVVVGTILVLLLLVAFVAGVGALKSGDPYYVTATPVDASAGDATGNQSAVNGTALPANRFPFTTEALAAAGANASGRSGPYWRGPLGVKEAFTHSPFDELQALRQRNPGSTAGDGVLVQRGNVTYRVGISREGEGS